MDTYPISVIIPTYNRKSFLPQALVSILKQTRKCAEIIVVDDGSADGTRGYVESLPETEQGIIRYFYLENKGPAAARNFGISKSQYEYIAFLDSDDHWHKRKLEKQFKAMENHPEFLISHTGEKWFRRGKHLNKKKRHLPRHGEIFDHCLELCAVGMSTVMVRKGLFTKVGNFDEGLRCCEDYDLWLRVSCRYPFLLIEEPLTIKEGGREDQVSYQYRVGMDKLRIEAILSLLDDPELNEEKRKQATEELARKSEIYGKGCIRHGRIEDGEKYQKLAEKCRLELI